MALAKLAVEHLERTQRPLRIAIDAAIWNFQTQAGQGGKNPALRTLFYRLLRILALPIHPLFVYDGKNKPLSKRGQTVSRYGTCLANESSKKLVEQFRFPWHAAPGEAEAECARLQQQGLVDMVMSQDGDAIMFGSRATLRNWSKEGARGNKEPTHVDVLDLQKIKDGPRLDPDGMILVALLSGGDYNQQGLPGFGVHVACDIARGGFGTDLLNAVKSNDDNDLREWRERLEYELETNESGYFKKRHKTLKIPESFPDRTVLSYYTDPAVSTPDLLKTLEAKWIAEWDAEINVQELRSYASHTFDWQYKPGAWKVVRSLARPLLAQRLQNGVADHLIRSSTQIHERREHYTMGGIPELRVSAAPIDIVGLDLDSEQDSPEYLELMEAEQDADNDGDDGDDIPASTQSPSKPKKPRWNPYQLEKMWIPETLVELGVPAILEDFNQAQRDKAELMRAKPAKKTKEAKANNNIDRIDRYFATSRSKEAAPTLQVKFVNGPSQTTAADDMLRPIAPISSPTKKAVRLQRTMSESSPDLKKYFKPAKQNLGTTLPTLHSQSSKYGGKHPRSTPSPSPTRDMPDSSQTAADILVGTIDNPIGLESSPMFATSDEFRAEEPRTPTKPKSTIALDSSSPIRDLENSVTQRKTRRVRKKFERAKTEGDMPSDSAVLAEILSQNQLDLGVHLDQSSSAQSAIPSDLGTGLKTDFHRRKLKAVPRDSLQGTWKELDVEEEVISRTTRRGPRVSCVDLSGH